MLRRSAPGFFLPQELQAPAEGIEGLQTDPPEKPHQREHQQQIMAQGEAEQLLLVIGEAVSQHGQRILQHAGQKNEEENGAEGFFLPG